MFSVRRTIPKHSTKLEQKNNMKVNQTFYAFTRSLNKNFFHTNSVFIASNDLDFYNEGNIFDLTGKIKKFLRQVPRCFMEGS